VAGYCYVIADVAPELDTNDEAVLGLIESSAGSLLRRKQQRQAAQGNGIALNICTRPGCETVPAMIRTCC